MVSTSKGIVEFCIKYKTKEITSKSIFLTPNSIPKYFYFLEKGFVRNFITSSEGEELSINIFGEQSILPLFSFFNDMSSTCFYYESLENSILRIIPKNEMFEFLKTNYEARENFSLICIHNLDLLLSKTKQLGYNDTNYRIISTLITLAENLGALEKNEFNLSLSHELIASFAGTTRETVTRKLNELKIKGVVANNYNNLKILKFNELKDLLDII